MPVRPIDGCRQRDCLSRSFENCRVNPVELGQLLVRLANFLIWRVRRRFVAMARRCGSIRNREKLVTQLLLGGDMKLQLREIVAPDGSQG